MDIDSYIEKLTDKFKQGVELGKLQERNRIVEGLLHQKEFNWSIIKEIIYGNE